MEARKSLGLVLLNELEDSVLEAVIDAVSKILEVDVDVLGSAGLRSGFNPGRGQWRADSVIRQGIDGSSSSKRMCVGLTGVDLYMPSLNFVFGLALRSERLAVVSWHRLRNGEDLFVSRLAKEIIHEVGHLEGLDHCPDKSCVMWFSNTLSETDAKGLGFCPACARRRQ